MLSDVEAEVSLFLIPIQCKLTEFLTVKLINLLHFLLVLLMEIVHYYTLGSHMYNIYILQLLLSFYKLFFVCMELPDLVKVGYQRANVVFRLFRLVIDVLITHLLLDHVRWSCVSVANFIILTIALHLLILHLILLRLNIGLPIALAV